MERTISVLTDVKDLAELLDGARIEQARLMPVSGRLQVVVECTRAMPERRQVARRGLFRRTKVPWTTCRLTLNRLTSVSVSRLADASPDQVPLLFCEAVPGGYQLTVQAPDGLRFVMSLEQLDGSFTDVGSSVESP